jgi:hypothetical protein
VSYTDLISVFYNVTEEQLVKVLDGLTREGLLQVRLVSDKHLSWQPATTTPDSQQQ